MTSTNEPSPFKVGDWVVYRPSEKTLGYTVMSPDQLAVGQRYRVAEIQKDSYIVVEGYRDPGGGLYWTNFESG
jgi:hypothetical protein